MFPTLENIGFAVGIVSISLFLAKIQVLPVYAGFMAAILKIVMTAMSHICDDCIIVFPTLENIGLAVGMVSISLFLANIQILPVYAGFMDTILKIVMISMSHISDDCIVAFHTLVQIVHMSVCIKFDSKRTNM